MAIEFQCPFCDVLIRVPDTAGGGKGKCPSCSKKVTVPRVSPPKKGAPAADKPFSFDAIAANEPQRKRTVSTKIASSPPPFVLGDEASPAEPIHAASASPEAPAAVDPNDPFGFDSDDQADDTPSASTSRAPVRKTKIGMMGAVGILFLIAGLGGAGFIGWNLWQEQQSSGMKGKLIAKTADELELPPIVIESSTFNRSEEELAPVLNHLDRAPAKLYSSLMEVLLEGTKHGLRVTLHSGKAARFYKVVIDGNKAFTEFKQKEGKKLDELRRKEMEKAAAKFFDDYQGLITKKSDQSSIGPYRDTLARPALVQGVGHQLVAIYGGTMYPCVYEDTQGAFYFLLPGEAMDFEIAGRPQEDESVLFPGKFTVEASGFIELPKKKGDKDGTKPAMKSSGLAQPSPKEKKMEGEEMKDGEKENMKE